MPYKASMWDSLESVWENYPDEIYIHNPYYEHNFVTTIQIIIHVGLRRSPR